MNSSRKWKARTKQAEDERLVDNGLIERPGFGTLADVGHFADEDDFGDDESIDDREGVVQIIEVVLFQQQHRVGHECGEEEGQIQGNDCEILEFALGLLLETRCRWVFGHLWFSSSPERRLGHEGL